MKKTLFLLLASILLFVFSPFASAEYTFPENLKTIGDEAFYGANVGETLLVPNGVERIGARAFAGTGLQLVSLPETIREIGPDAFDKDTGFEVLPGSYAESWAADNGYGYIEIKIRLNKETLDVYPGGVGTLEAVNSYADDLIYQWEELTDADSWNVIAGQNGKTLRLPYRPNEASTIVRCRAYLNSVQLDYSKTILGVFHPEKIDFVDEDCEVLSGDIVRLAWKSMGAGAAYTLHVWAEDSSGNGHWEPLAQTDSTAYTVYGLNNNTQYIFKVTAEIHEEGEQTVTVDGNEAVFTTKGEAASIIPKCDINGTALYVSWNAMDRALYDVTVTDADSGSQVIRAADLTSNAAHYYGLEKNKQYHVQVNATIPDSSRESGFITITGTVIPVDTGNEDTVIKSFEAKPMGEIVQLSWEELPEAEYSIYMRRGDEEEKYYATVKTTYYDIGGLERGNEYSFRLQAASGDWKSSFTDPVTVTMQEKNDVEYRALLVAEGNHAGSQRLESTYRDTERINSTLWNAATPSGGAYACLRRRDLTKTQLLSAIEETFRAADDNDVSLFYIGTHGNVDSSGANAGALSLVDSAGNEEIIRMDELASALGNVKGTVIVWFSSCGSGAAVYKEGEAQNGDSDFAPDPVGPAALNAAAVEAFAAHASVVNLNDTQSDSFIAADAEVFETGEFRVEGKFYVLTAARYHQEGYSDHYSYLAQHLCEGIETENGFMRGDANQDKKLTQHELFMYIKNREDTMEGGIVQNAQTYPLNSEYVLFVNE